MLKKTVLDYRYGHYPLLGLTEDFVSVHDLMKGTVSDYFLINVDCERKVNDRVAFTITSLLRCRHSCLH